MRSLGVYTIILMLMVSFSFVAEAADKKKVDSGQLRLKLTNVDLLIQTGKVKQAVDEMENIRLSFPGEPTVFSKSANVEQQIGRWQKAVQYLNQASALVPRNEDYTDFRDLILKEHSSHVAVDRNVRVTEDSAIEKTVLIRNKHRLSMNYYVQTDYEYNDVKILNLLQRDGSTALFNGIRNRITFALVNDKEKGDVMKALAYLAKRTIGLGFSYKWLWLTGSTTFLTELNKPYWGILDAIAFDGSRDRLEVTHQHRFTPRFSWTGQLALNRYGLDGKDNVATSRGFSMTFEYILPMYNRIMRWLGEGSFFSLRYIIDGEYPFSVKSRVNNAGVPFDILSLTSREIHNINLFVSAHINHRLRFETFGGYSYDRFGARSPSLGFAVNYRPKKGPELRILAERSISNNSGTSQTVELISGQLLWRY